MPKLTTPEERAKHISKIINSQCLSAPQRDVERQILEALVELVSIAEMQIIEKIHYTHKDCRLVVSKILRGLVDEVLPEEEKIK